MTFFQCWKNKYHAQRFLCSKIPSSQNNGKIKTSSHKPKLKVSAAANCTTRNAKRSSPTYKNEAMKNTRKTNI